ncbi:MAG: hypothetical protein ACJATI_000429 [Halioglobus sp.]|jgi:hypothetical protein
MLLMAAANVDVLVYGRQNEKARTQISDNELLSLF